MVTAVLFEDELYRNFLPMTYTRPIFDFICGGRRQWERAINAFGKENVTLLAREDLVHTIRDKTCLDVNRLPDEHSIFFLNGAVLAGKEEMENLCQSLDNGMALFDGNRLIAVKVSKAIGEKILERVAVGGGMISELIKKYTSAKSVDFVRILVYPWDLITKCGELLAVDFQEIGMLKEGHNASRGKYPVLRDSDVIVEDNTFFDATNGPIVLERNVEVQAQSRVSGPAWVREGSQLLSSIVREGTCIGEVCKIGGEIEHCIVEDHSNKAHGSFIGHSYVGEWVNIGALSVISNLKNTYGSIKMNVSGERLDSGLMKLGAFFADFSKVSISTAIYAGKKIGVASHIHGVIMEDVPSFTIWASSLGKQPHEIFIKSAIETQRRMMSRRNVEQKEMHTILMQNVFDETEDERLKKGVKKDQYYAT